MKKVLAAQVHRKAAFGEVVISYLCRLDDRDKGGVLSEVGSDEVPGCLENDLGGIDQSDLSEAFRVIVAKRVDEPDEELDVDLSGSSPPEVDDCDALFSSFGSKGFESRLQHVHAQSLRASKIAFESRVSFGDDDDDWSTEEVASIGEITHPLRGFLPGQPFEFLSATSQTSPRLSPFYVSLHLGARLRNVASSIASEPSELFVVQRRRTEVSGEYLSHL